MADLRHWLENLGLARYAETLAAQDIDLGIAPDLTDADLEKLGFSLGHRRKFLAAAAQLRANPPAAPEPATPARQSMERRQVTVVFTDLVGSTVLAGELDPEDLDRLLKGYRDACAAVIARHDGHIAQFLGDGVLAYFGFPKALEDAPERAVRAGLEIVREVGKLRLPKGREMQARVGIATGLVAASEMTVSGDVREQTVVGDTPNLAARLQSLAEPATVLVGPSTHQLTAALYEFKDAGRHSLKGFAEPVTVWRVVGERAAESRFAATRSARSGALVAREREVAFLLDAWQRAKQGNGHVALVSGEAGMGKSRLTEALIEQLRGESVRLLRCQCSPYQANTALFPFTELLRRSAGLQPDAPAAANLARIGQWLAGFGRESRTNLLLAAGLLEVESADALSAMEMTPGQRKAATLALIEDFVLAPAGGGEPVLLVVEDAHWSDPTTQALIDRLLQKIDSRPALALITHRPEFKSTWPSHPNATVIHCKALGAEQSAALIRQVASRMGLDEALVQQIAARSDGVPLFVEELTRSVLDRQSASSVAVPATLQDSLMARLDRLGRGREIALTAAVIGRQFSRAMLGAIAEAKPAELDEALAKLQDSALLFELRDTLEPGYVFNHSLVQEAAYQSNSIGRRRDLHKRIATYLQTQASPEPGLLAHHLSRAGDAKAACRYWVAAADDAGRKFAFAEALANLHAALAEAASIAIEAERNAEILEVQLKLGATYILQSGPGSDEGEAVLREAHGIAKALRAEPQQFQAAWGLYLKAARSRRLDDAKRLGEELNAVSAKLIDTDLQYESLHHAWGIAYFTGQTQAMLDRSLEGMQRYERERHHRFSYVFGGHDPGVCSHCVQAGALAIAGRGREVKPVLDAGFALVDALGHPLTLAFTHGNATTTYLIIGDLERCVWHAQALARAAEKYDFPLFSKVSTFTLAAAHARERVDAEVLAQLEANFEAVYNGYGFNAVHPGIVLAEALFALGRSAEALKVVERMLADSNTPETGLYISEIWRLRGELVLALSADAVGEAKTYLGTALRIAKAQGATIYEASAAKSLEKLAR